MSDTLIHHWSLMLGTQGADTVADDIRQTVEGQPCEETSYTPVALELAREAIDVLIARWSYEPYRMIHE